MYKDIETIYEKYGDLVFSLAIPNLLQKGVETCSSEKYREAVKQRSANPPTGDKEPVPLVNPELECAVASCSAELAAIDLLTLLKYIKTEYKIKGVAVYPGEICSFKERVGRKVVQRLFIQTPLNAAEKDRLRDTVRNRIVTNRGLDIQVAICDALRDLGIQWDFIREDYEIII